MEIGIGRIIGSVIVISINRSTPGGLRIGRLIIRILKGGGEVVSSRVIKYIIVIVISVLILKTNNNYSSQYSSRWYSSSNNNINNLICRIMININIRI